MDSTSCKIALVCTAIVAFKILKSLFDLLYDSVIASALNLQKVDWKNLGKWALVTGSTDGIGKAYSEALAKKGFNMVLISRTQSKLETIAKEIKEKYKVEVKIIAADFTKDNIYDGIQKQLEGLEIGVLINNVGMCYEYPEYFLEIPNHALFINNILNCNVLSVMKMCKIVMPDMVKRKKGVVINISSLSALLPNPMLTVYAATKATVTAFSKNLSCEYQKDGLIIQVVCPGYVATKMPKITEKSLACPSPEEFVESALRTVGLSEVTAGYLPHNLFNALMHFINGFHEKLSTYLFLRSYRRWRLRAQAEAAKTN